MRLTGSDGENCPVPDGRALRLAAVLYAADDRLGRAGWRQKVACLNDHKGELQVSWAACPTFAVMVVLSRAWATVGGECQSRHALAEQDDDRWTFDDDTVQRAVDAENGDVGVVLAGGFDSMSIPA